MSAASPIDSGEVFAVVPSYNHAPFVERSVRSIIDQSLPPKKLLVIDDGSTDGSPQVIERVLRDCDFSCELIVRENRGLSATLNEAFAKSDGEYFAYLGSDDVWQPAFLRERSKLLNEMPAAVLAYGHAYLIDENDHVLDCTRDWARYLEGDPLANLLEGVVPVTSGVVFRRSALEGLRWNEGARLEDYEVYLRLSRRGPFARGDDVLACWRKHTYNTSNEFAVMLEEWLAAQERAAPEIGLSPSELRKAQDRLELLAAAIFLRLGEKRAAMRLFRRAWRSAGGAGELFDLVGRMALPRSVLTGLAERRRRRRADKYRAATSTS
jgi:alpha-1,3-rhamnosyltransferase